MYHQKANLGTIYPILDLLRLKLVEEHGLVSDQIRSGRLEDLADEPRAALLLATIRQAGNHVRHACQDLAPIVAAFEKGATFPSLATGIGWDLVDSVCCAPDDPESDFRDLRVHEDLQPGDLVQLGFRWMLGDQDVWYEELWVEVIGGHEGIVDGRLRSTPAFPDAPIALGDALNFTARNILDVDSDSA